MLESFLTLRRQASRVNEVLASLLEAYVKILREEFVSRLVAVVLFGSCARGDADVSRSDIDLIIVLRDVDRLSIGRRLALLKEADRLLELTSEFSNFREAQGAPPVLDRRILSPGEVAAHPPIMLDLTTDAIVLHDEGLLTSEISKLRDALSRLGARRVELADGSWYWILKPTARLGEAVEL